MTETTASGRDDRLVAHFRYLLVLSRPRFWLYLAGPVLVGVAYAAGTTADLFAPAAVVLFGYFLVPANVFLYGVNDIYDREIDAENPKKDDREVRYGGQRYVPIAVVVCGVFPLLFVSVVPTAAWPWIVAFLFLGAAYSAPPFRFKTTPLLDSVSNGLYVAPGVAAYAAVAGTQPPVLAILGGWLWAMGMHTFSAIPDIEPDRATGTRTTATALGEHRTYAYCGACWLASAVAFGAIDYRLGAVMLVYPGLIAGIVVSNVAVDRAYWWFPAINTAVGTLLTVGGLWRVVHG
ncbi:prenyltransferase [Natronobacterium gregoryi]|uniref:Prenyltransferase n=2 Tax=Natronobacterium gregoryi TaxID=44930 RepID=L0AIV6_NATGS|nr:prenyltransferase [Natronobacterium gregoryi]AFZ73379.1 4-hydroxybenzoate polyprenyltransferase-like prenyltransferase [Natronobacterium gregoryi SP2]ELY68575.1 prenyltransferase [Natronobacterium gregoryi SP2]PLK19660.1 lycopene elongase [Natronobacterium gregoryi SP2]SFI73661.1 4-hydroxybenzoate polyprenyltransferase [Natronobacterium gregoryi]